MNKKPNKIYYRKISQMGMELDELQYMSCVTHFGTGKDWATLYDINSFKQGKGHATKLHIFAKRFYESKGMKFGGSVALNDRMKYLYKKLKIKEYV